LDNFLALWAGYILDITSFGQGEEIMMVLLPFLVTTEVLFVKDERN
jgi:hypothetical protein